MFCSAVELGVMTCCWSLFCQTEARRSRGCYIPSCRTVDITIRLTNTNNTTTTSPTVKSGLLHYCVIIIHNLNQYTLTLTQFITCVWRNNQRGCLFFNPPPITDTLQRRGLYCSQTSGELFTSQSYFHLSCMPCVLCLLGWGMVGR